MKRSLWLAPVVATSAAMTAAALVLGRPAQPRAVAPSPKPRADVWWHRTLGPTVVFAAPRADAPVLGCLPADTFLEETAPVDGLFTPVLAETWSGYVPTTALGAGWHANALGHSFVGLAGC